MERNTKRKNIIEQHSSTVATMTPKTVLVSLSFSCLIVTKYYYPNGFKCINKIMKKKYESKRK